MTCASRVGSQRPEVSIRKLAEIVIDVVGADLEIVAREPTPGSPERRCPDMSKTLALTGYEAQTPLEEGVRRTYEGYRSTVFEALPAASK